MGQNVAVHAGTIHKGELSSKYKAGASTRQPKPKAVNVVALPIPIHAVALGGEWYMSKRLGHLNAIPVSREELDTKNRSVCHTTITFMMGE